MIVFGPDTSRCLGRSVGINNIPPKICSDACVYCQRKTSKIQIKREAYNNVEYIVREVSKIYSHISHNNICVAS
ncbi:hypothetical protein SAMN05660242_3028 [Thermoanaerobacterium sp. RBIITD]|nr:hypothetical protein SAMN05660242_3028 [Thermoanaerobacterium sp. RBIITD]